MSKQHLRSGVIFLVLALFPTSGWSQSLRGSLSGIVKDPSGATVPNVALTLKNVSTSFQSTASTAGDGLFSFPNLPAGNYELKAGSHRGRYRCYSVFQRYPW